MYVHVHVYMFAVFTAECHLYICMYMYVHVSFGIIAALSLFHCPPCQVADKRMLISCVYIYMYMRSCTVPVVNCSFMHVCKSTDALFKCKYMYM